MPVDLIQINQHRLIFGFAMSARWEVGDFPHITAAEPRRTFTYGDLPQTNLTKSSAALPPDVRKGYAFPARVFLVFQGYALPVGLCQLI